MARLRAALNEEGRTEITCPECGGQVTIAVDPDLLRHSTPIRARARCACGWSHAVYLERRTAARREVNLGAEAVVDGERFSIRLRNLSRTGARLELPSELEAGPGARLLLRFTLNPGRRQEFEKLLELRWREGEEAGGEFVAENGSPDYDGAYDLALALHQG